MKWNTYQENICILGMQHSGKTTLAKSILDSIPNVPRLIISPQQPEKLYGSYGKSISTLAELLPGGAFVWTGKLNEKIFDAICDKMMTFANMVMLVDDAHEFCAKQKLTNAWSTLINSGRNRGIVSIFISPAPSLLHNVLLQSSQHMISFRFKLESQIEYSRKNFFGEIGWLLLTPNLRPDKFRKYEKMGEHDYLYQNVNSEFVSYIRENGEVLTLETISDFPKNENYKQEEPEPVNDVIDETKVDGIKNETPGNVGPENNDPVDAPIGDKEDLEKID